MKHDQLVVHFDGYKRRRTMPLMLRLRAECEECDNTFKFEVDLDDVRLDLNEKNISGIEPPYSFYEKGWDYDVVHKSFYGGKAERKYFCPNHNEKKK